MSWLSRLIGSGTDGVGSLAKDLREAFKGKEVDPNKQLEQATKIVQLQTDINKAEAAHRSVFVAGWRPFVGWVCGLSLLYVSILDPFMRFVSLMFGYEGEFPVIDTTITMQVLLGMLGLAAARTVEKKKGLSK